VIVLAVARSARGSRDDDDGAEHEKGRGETFDHDLRLAEAFRDVIRAEIVAVTDDRAELRPRPAR
jgi:hypothetical protein